MTSRRGPPSSSSASWPVFSSMPAWRARTAPDRVGSITKQTVSGPMHTHSHHFAGPPPSRGANTRHVVSSACRCQEPRDRSVTASASGTSSAPACAQVPAKVAGETSAPCLARPFTREFMLRPATYRSVNSIAMNPLENRPFPIAFGGPGAITVPGTRHEHLPVQLLPGHVIPQRRERLPALRAAVPAAREVPEHLKPGQVRVIPPPRPGPRTPLVPRAAPAVPARPAVTSGTTTGRRLRARLLRRPPEQHPLQNNQIS